MISGAYRVPQQCPIRGHMTVSRSTGLSNLNSVTWFSLGADTSISRESYDRPVLYIGDFGHAEFLIGDRGRRTILEPGSLLVVHGGTLCGVECKTGVVYTEIITKKELNMNNIVKSGKAVHLKDLISYEANSIANLDIAKNDTMKFALMAFAEGTCLQPHRAPGPAIVTVLEGSAVISYEGSDYHVSAGDSFRFDKNGLHSVTADGPFKMSLLLVLE